jgi:hypothetical protein
MVNLGICVKCPKCIGVEPSRTSDDGLVVTHSAARCRLVDGCLMADSDLPEECPYNLEQMLTEPDTERLVDLTKEVVRQQNRRARKGATQ